MNKTQCNTLHLVAAIVSGAETNRLARIKSVNPLGVLVVG